LYNFALALNNKYEHSKKNLLEAVTLKLIAVLITEFIEIFKKSNVLLVWKYL